MHLAVIAGLNVQFPYEPYSIQKAYMSRMITCLHKKQNGLLESPTGTGKTLSILCSSLAWLEKETEKYLANMSLMNQPGDVETDKEDYVARMTNADLPRGFLFDRPKVIYSSRTHAQLSQAMKEMKRTNYNHFKSVILGSRDQLCIHPDVSKLESNSAKNTACRAKTRYHECTFYEGYEGKVGAAYDDLTVIDVEDLVERGLKHKVCPFYATKTLRTKADVLFTPYNYLLDPAVRASQGIELSKAVVIFDEGHNIESMCEDSASAEITSETLAMCAKESTELLRTLSTNEEKDAENELVDPQFIEQLRTIQVEEVALVKTVVVDLIEAIDAFADKLNSKPKDKQEAFYDPKWILDIIADVHLTIEFARRILATLRKIEDLFTNTSPTGTGASLASRIICFQVLTSFLKTIYPEDISDETYPAFKTEQFSKKFKLCLELVSVDEKNKFKKPSGNVRGWLSTARNPDEKEGWKLHLFCLSPSVGINAMMQKGVHSVVITSGTLAPLGSFPVEMELPFEVQLQNKHVIESDQLKVCMLSNGLCGTKFDSTYNNKDNRDYYRALGNTLVDYAKIVPGGILIFFASYAVKNRCFDRWADDGGRILNSLQRYKPVFHEPRNKWEFTSTLQNFKQAIDDDGKQGAILAGVCRGKLSEGLDLSNKYCRAVIMVGLPYPSKMDPRIRLKELYLTEKNMKGFSSSVWYSLQMKRALNQAIGRVVRHKEDFGIVLLLDYRFPSQSDGLSNWIKPFVTHQDYSATTNSVERFFEKFDSVSEKVYKVAPIFQAMKPASLQKPKSVRQPKEEVPEVSDSEVLVEYKAKDFRLKREDFVKQEPCLVEIHERNGRASKPGSFSDHIDRAEAKANIDRNVLENFSNKLKVLVKREDQKSPSQKRSSELDEDDSKKKQKFAFAFKSISEEVIDVEAEDAGAESTAVVFKRMSFALKALFKDTDKLARLREAIRTYKESGEIRELFFPVRAIFQDVPSPQRDTLLADLSMILDRKHRQSFLVRLKVNGNLISKDICNMQFEAPIVVRRKPKVEVIQ